MNGFPVLVRIMFLVRKIKEKRKKKLTDLILGQDNPSTGCIVGDVPNIFEGDLSDHDGPYNGVTMGC